MIQHVSKLNLARWFIPLAAISVLLLVILFALGILGGSEKNTFPLSAWEREKPGNILSNTLILPNGAETLTLTKQTTNNPLSWQGLVRSRLSVKIAPKLNARIVDISVHPGDFVKKNAIIVRLDERDLRAAYQAAHAAQMAAQARAMQANAEEKRISNLYDKQAATRQDYETILAEAQTARAIAQQAASNAEQSKLMLGENILYAPFDGIVDERLQEPGDMGMPNQAILSLHKPDDLRFEASIASHCIAPLKIGMSVKVRFENDGKGLEATIDEIAPEIDSKTRTQTIKIKLPKTENLKHGQFGWLELACETEQKALMIPKSAIIQYGQLQAVKVIEANRIAMRHIRTGKSLGDRVEVLSGLHEGETILSNGGILR